MFRELIIKQLKTDGGDLFASWTANLAPNSALSLVVGTVRSFVVADYKLNPTISVSSHNSVD